MADSASRQVSAIIKTCLTEESDVAYTMHDRRQDVPDWMGYDPFAVSPDNMTQSAPSRTALATSLTSARVGRGLYCSGY